jgi:hypothetical protein
MVESARKHGPFDHRYPVRHEPPAPSWDLGPDREGGERLEWSAFLARFFPNRRRHDFAVLAAYEAYRNTLEHETPQQRPTTRRALPGRRDGGSRSRPAAVVASTRVPGRSLVSGRADLGMGGWRFSSARSVPCESELPRATRARAPLRTRRIGAGNPGGRRHSLRRDAGARPADRETLLAEAEHTRGGERPPRGRVIAPASRAVRRRKPAVS